MSEKTIRWRLESGGDGPGIHAVQDLWTLHAAGKREAERKAAEYLGVLNLPRYRTCRTREWTSYERVPWFGTVLMETWDHYMTDMMAEAWRAKK